MKRSTCLAAFLVGLSLSLTVASAASAAPTKAPAKSTKVDGKKAKPAKSGASTEAASPQTPNAVTQDEPQPTEGGGTAPAAPTPAPAEPTPTPAEPEAQPAVSIGTSSPPVADTPSGSPATPEAKPKPRPFAGSSLAIYNSMTTNTVFRGQTQYDNPTVDSSLWITPRYAINEAFQLRGRVTISYEYTNSDTTVTRNEPVLSDTTLQLFYRKIPEFAGIQPYVAASLTAPTSKASRYKTMVVTPGIVAQFSRPFEHVLGGDWMLIASAVYSHPFYKSQTPEVVVNRDPGSLQCFGGGDNCNNLAAGGTMNQSDILSYAFIVSAEWGKWNPALYYLGSSQWMYKPKDVELNGKRIESGQSADPPGVRQTHYFSAWLDYNFNSWFTGEIGYQAFSTALNENGQRLNPAEVIFNRYQDTRVYLGASFQLDNLVKVLQGGEKGEAGIVRAQNNKTPALAF